MNELTLEVLAKETHERAVSYFRVAEEYGYKFIMEVKKSVMKGCISNSDLQTLMTTVKHLGALTATT
ncbi:hypothetical protein FOI68_18220 [Brevibacillus sp. LEMMJ03]|jgi:hypothetical protein|uniref:hypothetical protein n=1 Tax=Brevibacillus sp. LEMMJ03 TaxID=2595056 RepID=UPI00117EA25E|nr:hypothetical protein [Brevibacillus sp. LEMMJ03]TRY24174.1 hypothetical protein FOI68_18220 [Brevibacillus sp. LEMMJ03]